MNIATSRFTISTILAAVCAMAALVAAEPAHAQSAAPSMQRIEIVGHRIAPTQRIVIVGKRQAEPTLQRIEIVGQRQRAERVAIVGDAAPRL
jgi:hypothetical protein